jgi:predicted GNAT family acetyltransferase
LEPAGCFAVDWDGRLAATATVMPYGQDLAWIGMVLTAPDCRGRGLASALMQRAVEFAERNGIAKISLDATNMGIGLYRRFHFESDEIVRRWERPAVAGIVPPVAVEGWRLDAELDRRAFGADRSELLQRLSHLESSSLPGRGYAMGRSGSHAAYFGPCVAVSPADATTLLHWYLARHPSEPVCWDILSGNQEAETLAREHGFVPVRELTRMVRILRHDARIEPPDVQLVFAIAGFECG